ncbi:hemerythrin domain-containing protein [Brevibacillus ginsengisoli]|uniref:hemerythrin domain-containing protein n=1 Tax=Brevibacillus ginsengisoli TaxID=363854 RepID=UPI003CE771D8
MNKPTYQPKLDLTDWQKANRYEVDQIKRIVAPELHSFIDEHADVAMLMDIVREGYNQAIYQQALNVIGTELDHHFLYEEDFILPRLRSHIAEGQVGPAAKLIQEHQLIRKHHQETIYLFAEHDPAAPSKELVQKINLLAYLLKKHIEKEDHYLFPMFTAILTDEEKAAIARDVAQEDARRAALNA